MGSWQKEMMKQMLQMQQQQFASLNAPNPYLEKMMGLDNRIIDWHTNPNNTVKDIYKHPTLGSQLPVFQMAKGLRDQGRLGRGIAGLGDKFNPQYAKELGMEDSTNRNIYASGMLETGLQNELGGAKQDLENLVMNDTQRRTAANGSLGTAYQTLDKLSQGGWGGFFKGLLGGAVQGFAGGLGSSLFGRGDGGSASAGASGFAAGF